MPSLKTIVIQVTPFVQNASIVICTQTNKCAFVDPGGDIDMLLDVAKSNNLIPEKILLTHGHIDHAGGAQELSNILKIQIEGPHIADKFLLDELKKQGQMFGMMSENCSPDRWLDEGDVIKIGDVKLDTYFCPDKNKYLI